MITIKDYKVLLQINYDIISRQTAGLSEEDMLLQPTNGGNCMLWVLGHLTNNLAIILEVLGGEQPPYLAEFKCYGYGSHPVTGVEPGLHTGQELLLAYQQLHEAVQARLDDMDPSDFDEEIEVVGDKQRRGWHAFFFEFHHAYHIGQLELLRNLAGFTEKII